MIHGHGLVITTCGSIPTLTGQRPPSLPVPLASLRRTPRTRHGGSASGAFWKGARAASAELEGPSRGLSRAVAGGRSLQMGLAAAQAATALVRAA